MEIELDLGTAGTFVISLILASVHLLKLYNNIVSHRENRAYNFINGILQLQFNT